MANEITAELTDEQFERYQIIFVGYGWYDLFG